MANMNQPLGQAAQTKEHDAAFMDAVKVRLEKNIDTYVSDVRARGHGAPPLSPTERQQKPPFGTVIPQRRYCQGTPIPPTEGPQCISFVTNGGQWLPASRALSGQCGSLQGGDSAVFAEQSHTINLRFEWVGYPGLGAQIRTVNYQEVPRCISRAKLLTEIAKQLEKFIEAKKSVLIDAEHARFRVGPGAIELSQLSIVGLERVSRGSWQPCLVYIG